MKKNNSGKIVTVSSILATFGTDAEFAYSSSKSNIIHSIPLPENDPMVRKPDITKIQKELNWNPIISLAEGLTQTISYFQEQKEIITLK